MTEPAASDAAARRPRAPVVRQGGLFGAMTLRWRLVIAFLSVSAIPVLIASLVVAELIADLFGKNMERWLQDAALFVTQRSVDDQNEARQALAIIAASLSNDADDLDRKLIEMSTDLLTSVGYDAVAIYDATGRILYGHGLLGDGRWLPRKEHSRFFVVKDQGHPVLLLGSAKAFQRSGQTYYVFVGDRWDGTVVNMSGSSPALRVQVFAVSDGRAAYLDTDSGDAGRLPDGVLETLAAGTPSMAAKMFEADNLATGFAALRDTRGHLVGIVACRVARQASLMSHVRTLELFVLLSVIAGVISLAVALTLSKLISRPLSQLTQALRRVHEGDYSVRVIPEGGRELAELAAGFNDMTGQLETLHCRETLMRRREKLVVLGEAAAVMAHEIRNPLGIIKTSSQVLRMKVALPPASDRLVGFVLDEVGRIEGLVQELLDYARPKSIVRQTVDVGTELSSVLEFAASELAQRRVAVKTAWPEDKAIVQGDAAQLHQTFLNILLNAMDAMPDGGTLTVAVERDEPDIAISISDTGVGVAPEIGERIFEPFVTTKRRGTGLGLARVRDVMEKHGGSVRCESVSGAGTTFILRLPAAAADREGDPQ